jgi:hypothetical protein
MTNTVTYEWRVNLCGEYGDIDDFDVFDTYAEAREHERQVHAHGIDLRQYTEIELTRTEGNDDDGILDRGYATVGDDGTLPDRFCCGNKVPVYKRREVA